MVSHSRRARPLAAWSSAIRRGRFLENLQLEFSFRFHYEYKQIPPIGAPNRSESLSLHQSWLPNDFPAPAPG